MCYVTTLRSTTDNAGHSGSLRKDGAEDAKWPGDPAVAITTAHVSPTHLGWGSAKQTFCSAGHRKTEPVQLLTLPARHLVLVTSGPALTPPHTTPASFLHAIAHVLKGCHATPMLCHGSSSLTHLAHTSRLLHQGPCQMSDPPPHGAPKQGKLRTQPRP